MTPERLIIKVMSELHREGISPNLENIDSEQAHQTAERLLKLLGGLTDPEPRSIESGHRPRHLSPAQRDGRRVDSDTQLLPIVQPAHRSPQHPTQTVQPNTQRQQPQLRYEWGRASAIAAHPA